jgi:uncharacterized protein (UPF0276 family)
MGEGVSLPALGVGVVFAPGLEPLIEGGAPAVDVLEIEPQTLWPGSGGENAFRMPPAVVDWLRGIRLPKLVHGVGAPVAGAVPAPPGFASAFALAAHEVDAVWASEHLNFNRFRTSDGDYNTGLFFPPLQTIAGVRVAVANIQRVKRRLSVPFAIETPVSYLKCRSGELTDGEFVARVVEGAGCGIVLDLHNLWANERNGRGSVRDFIESIPLERVWEIHVAGGFEHRGFWLDAHSGLMPEPLIDLVGEIVPRLPALRAIVYEILPTHVAQVGIEAIAKQLQQLRSAWQSQPAAHPPIDCPPPCTPTREEVSQVRSWETALGRLITRNLGSGGEVGLGDLDADPGIAVMRDLVWQFRAGSIADLLPRSTRLALRNSGEAAVRQLFDAYFSEKGPALFGVDEARGFAGYANCVDLQLTGYIEALEEDLAALGAMTAHVS